MPQAPTFLSLRLVIVREGKNSTLCCEVSHAWSLNQPPPTNTRFIRPSIQRGQLADWLANNLFPPALPAESEDSSKKKGGGLVQFPKKIYNCDWKSHNRVIHPKIWSSAINDYNEIAHWPWNLKSLKSPNFKPGNLGNDRKSLPRYPDQKLIREIMKPSHWWIGRISLAEALGL